MERLSEKKGEEALETMIIKGVGAALVIVACNGFGAYPVRKMKCRIEEMELFYYCLLRLKSEICHTMNSLPDALLNAAAQTGKKGSSYAKAMLLLAGYLHKGKEGYDALVNKAAEKAFAGSVLMKEEKEEFCRVFLSLGGADKERQAAMLDYYAGQMILAAEDEKKKKKERAYVYRSLGILCGIFLTVILF